MDYIQICERIYADLCGLVYIQVTPIMVPGGSYILFKFRKFFELLKLRELRS